jgi:hypothetical protein
MLHIIGTHCHIPLDDALASHVLHTHFQRTVVSWLMLIYTSVWISDVSCFFGHVLLLHYGVICRSSLNTMNMVKLILHNCYTPICLLLCICHHLWFPVNIMLFMCNEYLVINSEVSWAHMQHMSAVPLTARFWQRFTSIHIQMGHSILSTHMCPGLSSDFFLSYFPTKLLYILFVSHTWTTCDTHLNLLLFLFVSTAWMCWVLFFKGPFKY